MELGYGPQTASNINAWNQGAVGGVGAALMGKGMWDMSKMAFPGVHSQLSKGVGATANDALRAAGKRLVSPDKRIKVLSDPRYAKFMQHAPRPIGKPVASFM